MVSVLDVTLDSVRALFMSLGTCVLTVHHALCAKHLCM